MENKQTAVEWLFDKITQNGEIRWRGTRYIELFEQAKEMEKEQIMNAYMDSYGNITEPEDYYNETYGSTKQMD